jgi:hypothetical protein
MKAEPTEKPRSCFVESKIFLGVRWTHKGCMEILQQGWKERRFYGGSLVTFEDVTIWEDVPVHEAQGEAKETPKNHE